MICYTTITGNYDILKEPLVVSEGWEYVVFSDRFIDSDVWQCHITEKHNREIKILGHKEFFNVPTLYVDGSIQIKGDLNEFVSRIPQWFTLWKHPHRSCTYKEAQAVIRLKGCKPTIVNQQMNRYKKAGLPGNWGLAACGIMYRDFSDPVVREMCNDWFKEWEMSCGRDQLSLPYTFWKRGFEMDLFDNLTMNKYFNWLSHDKNRHNPKAD